MTITPYPEVNELVFCLMEFDINFQFLDTPANYEEMAYVRVRMGTNKGSFVLPVEDEYGELDIFNPAMNLHLVLAECDRFMEPEDYLVWCKENGYKVASIAARAIYFDLRDVVPKIRDLIKQTHPLPSHEVEFNTGMMQSLRSLKD